MQENRERPQIYEMVSYIIYKGLDTFVLIIFRITL